MALKMGTSILIFLFISLLSVCDHPVYHFLIMSVTFQIEHCIENLIMEVSNAAKEMVS